MTPRVSVVVPTLNRCDRLEYVLPTLASQTLPADEYEILLCDAGSTDGTFDLVARLGLPNLRVVACPGQARGPSRNAGIRAARGALVLFNDADILADRELLARHAQAHVGGAPVAVVGCEVRVDSLDEYRAVQRHPRLRRTLHSGWKRRLSWLFFVTGNASVRRDALVRVGLFDEQFTAYGHEDLELGYRLEQSGVRIRHEPRAVNYHWHPETFEARLAKMEASGRATIKLYRKHRDWRILLRMGVNPVSLGVHGLLPANGRVVAACQARGDICAACRGIALQHAYLTGVKAARRSSGPGGSQ
jgi:glycosyltransferase involved in cell wall biosynthesis